jgi:hypothetical protein
MGIPAACRRANRLGAVFRADRAGLAETEAQAREPGRTVMTESHPEPAALRTRTIYSTLARFGAPQQEDGKR